MDDRSTSRSDRRRPRAAAPRPGQRAAALVAGLLAAVLLLAACGNAASGPTPDAVARRPLPAAPDPALPLIVVRQDWGPTAFPDAYDPRSAVLYGDGTLVAGDPADPRMLGNRTATLDRPAMERAWAAVVGGGLGRDGSLGLEGLFDAGMTTFVVDDGSVRTSFGVYALGSEPVDGQSPFPVEDLALRTNASIALATLRELAEGERWLPPALLLWIGEHDEAAVPPAVPWTPSLDLATASTHPPTAWGRRCAVIEGRIAGEVAAFLHTVPRGQVVEQAGRRYSLDVRPIYPDEAGSVACPGS